MTAPRQVLRGTTYLVTRRCLQRQFLLRPSATTTSIFQYLLAVGAERYGLQIHAYCVLSNHFHLVVTDPRARLPAFFQYVDGLLARAINASIGNWDSFWDGDSYSAVTLAAPRDVVDKTAYVLANPVAAGLVRSARQWPGLWSAPEQLGTAVVKVRRPKVFFDPKGKMPETVDLKLTVPPCFASDEAFREQVAAAYAEREVRAASSRTGFLGVLKVRAQRPSGRPKKEERRRGLRPRVAAKDPWKRLEVLGRLAEFLRGYREALAARREGEVGVVFPAGTYHLRVQHGVACAGSG